MPRWKAEHSPRFFWATWCLSRGMLFKLLNTDFTSITVPRPCRAETKPVSGQRSRGRGRNRRGTGGVVLQDVPPLHKNHLCTEASSCFRIIKHLGKKHFVCPCACYAAGHYQISYCQWRVAANFISENPAMCYSGAFRVLPFRVACLPQVTNNNQYHLDVSITHCGNYGNAMSYLVTLVTIW